MKKKLLLLVTLVAFTAANAQNDAEPNPYEKKNEFRLNALLPLGGTFEASYERILNAKSAVGITGLYVFDNGTNNEDMNYSISPYYRRYFGKKYAAGFFVEGFGMFTSIDGKKVRDPEYPSKFTENPDVYDLALGAGGGWKWVSKSGFLFEANVGYGGLLFNAKKTDHNIVAKFGLSVGYRF